MFLYCLDKDNVIYFVKSKLTSLESIEGDAGEKGSYCHH